MSDKFHKIDINSTAREIAKEVLDELKQSGISGATKDCNNCTPSGVLFTCIDKECKSGDFTCHPAKTFTCENKFVG